jgi:hypothetical protein
VGFGGEWDYWRDWAGGAVVVRALRHSIKSFAGLDGDIA